MMYENDYAGLYKHTAKSLHEDLNHCRDQVINLYDFVKTTCHTKSDDQEFAN